MLIGRNYTRLSHEFLSCDKEYIAEVFLGVTTDTFDCEGQVIENPLIFRPRQALNKLWSCSKGK